MRNILFRGQTRRKGEKVYAGTGKPVDGNWVYGGITQGTGDFSIIYSYEPVEKHVVYTDTVGQFTGLTDKNGKKIFEGDIVKYTRKNMYAPETSFHKKDIVSMHKIYWDNSNFRFSQEHYDLESKRCIGGGNMTFTDWRATEEEIEVIGNIHDNPELLKESQNV